MAAVAARPDQPGRGQHGAQRREFYRTLGLDMGEGPPWTDHHRAAMVGGGLDMDLDSTAFAAVGPGLARGRTGVVIGFKVADRSRGSGLRDRDRPVRDSRRP